jgi:hypothetical protein
MRTSVAVLRSPDEPAFSRGLRVVLVLVLALGAALVALPASPALAAAPFGYSLRLDGVDDYASAPDNPSLDLGVADGEDFTVEAFVYVDNSTKVEDEIDIIWHKGTSTMRGSVRFRESSTDLIFFHIPGGYLSTGTNLSDGWHHMAWVFDNRPSSESDRLSIFLDGVELAYTTAVSMSGFPNTTSAFQIGGYAGAGAWDDWMDEVRVSDAVRYGPGSYSVPASPFTVDVNTRALWHFDDTACSSTFSDSSPHGNTLTGYNGATIDLYGATTPTFALDASTYSTGEADGTTTVTVTRSGAPTPSVSVDYATSDGTATAGSDYTSASGTLNFACGEMEKTFTVPVADDSLYEPNETVELALSAPTGGAVLGSPAAATLTITDDDPEPEVRFDSATYSADEGVGEAMVTVELSGESSLPSAVDYATSDGTATAGGDYTAASGTMSFAVGETSKTFAVPIIEDGVVEGDETVVLTLSSPMDARLGVPSTATLTINDDDTPPDTTAPDTKITKGPKKKTFLRKAKFAFVSTEIGSTFQCKVDRKAWNACTSPYKIKVKPGKHKFLVRAIDTAGNVDATPAAWKWTVKRRS